MDTFSFWFGLAFIIFYIYTTIILLRYVVARIYIKKGKNEEKRSKAIEIASNSKTRKYAIAGVVMNIILLLAYNNNLVQPFLYLCILFFCVKVIRLILKNIKPLTNSKNGENGQKHNIGEIILNPKNRTTVIIICVICALLYPPLFIYAMLGLPFIIVYLIWLKEETEYKESTYYKQTSTEYSALRKDKGKLGEYRIYKNLKHLETDGAKFVFNAYIPKDNGTTEIDVIMLCSKGIFVFESKNYKGWIYGSQDGKTWCQVLPTGHGEGKSRKTQFYNPLMQNNTHITCLEKLLVQEYPLISYVVFSDDCEFKNVTINNVIHIRNLKSVLDAYYTINPIDVLELEQIDDIYNMLYPYTQVDETVKEQHINQFK